MGRSLRIFGWWADYSGCGWYRIMLPMGALNELGLANTGFSNKLTDSIADNTDVIVGQRVFRPRATQFWQTLAKRKSHPLLVYELDDDLLHIDDTNPAAAVYQRTTVQENILANIKAADLVTVSTEPLAEQIRKLHPRVVVLPNCIPQALLDWRHGSYANRLTIGWQGSPTHDRDWQQALQPMARWLRSRPEVELHTIGGVPADFPQLPNHRHTGWVESIPQYYRVIDWDIALAPLASTLFNRSKSDLRILEAGMLGIPVVASAVPAYRHSVIHLETGLLVGSPSEWRGAMEMLANDEDAREQMGREAREWARGRTIEANAPLWLKAYTDAMG